MKITFLTMLLTICFTGYLGAQETDPFYPKRKRMVEEQMRRRGIADQRVLNAVLKVKRHLFVPLADREFAYEDHPLPIGHDQTISQPFIVAYMTQVLQLKASDRVLEIGTGSGYQAAILAELVRQVYTIEIVEGLAQEAAQRLKDLGYQNIRVKHGDGFKGWPEHAPFDAIIVTAAPKEVPPDLIEQLAVGGRMIIPIGAFTQELYLITKTAQGIEKQAVLPVRFVPMIKGKD